MILPGLTWPGTTPPNQIALSRSQAASAVGRYAGRSVDALVGRQPTVARAPFLRGSAASGIRRAEEKEIDPARHDVGDDFRAAAKGTWSPIDAGASRNFSAADMQPYRTICR